MVGSVRKPLDEYQIKERRAPIITDRRNRLVETKNTMPVYSTDAPTTMPVATQSDRTEGKPVKTKDSPDYIKRKVKGFSAEPM